MSFSFSQSLLGDISSHPGTLSQELDDSQDSGYAATLHPNNFFPPPSNFPPPAPLRFPPRRTLPRPPTWPNLQQPEQGGSKWRFGGKQDVKRSPLERDLQHHLEEVSGQVMKMPGKVSSIVEESVKYLKCVYSKEATNGRVEYEMMAKSMSGVEEKMKVENTMAGEMVEDIIALETGLTDIAALAEAVTVRGKGITNRLTGLLHRLDREHSTSRRVLSDVSSLTRNLRQMEDMDKTMVMEQLNATNPVVDDKDKASSPSPSLTRRVFTKPLPSIRQLPALPPLLYQQGGIRQGFERSCRIVRGGGSGIGMDMVEGRDKRGKVVMGIVEEGLDCDSE